MGFELYELFNFRSKNYSEKSKICVWIRQTKKIEHCKNVHDLNMYSQVLRRFIARGLVLGSPRLVPLRLRLVSLFYSLINPRVLKIKITWLISITKVEYAALFVSLRVKWTKVCISIFQPRADALFSLSLPFFFSQR